MYVTDGSDTKAWNSPGAQNSDGTYQYAGARTHDANWLLSWNYNVDPDPAVNGVFSITNTLGVTNSYTVIVTFPLSIPITPSSLTGGSVQGGVTDNNGNGATLATAGTNPFYMSLIDGGNFKALFTSPQNLTVGAFLSGTTGIASFGTPIPSFPGPAVNSTIGIRLQFTLTPGDSASFTSVFVAEPVPEPSTLALAGCGAIGLAALAVRRRRAKSTM
jgi:hypothetical protein